MRSNKLCTLFFVLASLTVDGISPAAEPRAKAGYKLELIAADPEIVTPIGGAFDRQGRLLVVESHTHLRAEGYTGPDSDRIRMLSDSDGDGKLDKWTTFADGFRHAMNLLACDDGGLYVVTRGYLYLLHDTDNDGVADKKVELLRLETKDDYPHNALGAIARDIDGTLVIGYGENHGVPFKLTGADGTVIEATGGQDGFYRITADGKHLRRIASGMWNPFSACVLPDGRIFAVENDPDGCPPCRLLHIVPGGDYGYLFQYGRAGTHPLQAWNGELPGTLPMVCGTGEGPTAVVSHAGGLWVTSWGDQRIERYELSPRGASYSATRDTIVQGDTNFRPTGMTIAPDDSIYFADWVLRDYPVHGRGKIWRLDLPKQELKRTFPPRSTEDLTAQNAGSDLIANAASQDPFVRTAAAWSLSQGQKVYPIAKVRDNPLARITFLRSVWLRGDANPEGVIRLGLSDESPEVRLFAVRWIADERIMSLRDDVAKLLEGPQANARLYLAVLGTLDWLDRKPNPGKANFSEELLVAELDNDQRSPEAHALALSYLKPINEYLTNDRLNEFLHSQHQGLRLEAIRTLAQQLSGNRRSLLVEVAEDSTQSDAVRAEAIVGLSGKIEKHRKLLESLAESDRPALQREAKRALRLADAQAAPSETKPPADDLDAWNKLLAKGGDASSGRRLFFSPVGPKCSVCHTYAGRGGNVGPELTQIGTSTSRERIIASIIQPSREIAPDYQPWLLIMNDGKSFTGLLGIRGGVKEEEEYIDETGETFKVHASDIESRQASTKSIMPDNLQATLTIDDLCDLITFLASPNK